MYKKEMLEFQFDIIKGNYIKGIFFEFEKGRALAFSNKEGDKLVYIPRSMIKGGFTRDKNIPQDIRVQYQLALYWIPWR